MCVFSVWHCPHSEYQRLQADVERLRKEQARTEGHKLGQEDQVRLLQKELQSELYSTTEERYMDMVIKLKVGGGGGTLQGALNSRYNNMGRSLQLVGCMGIMNSSCNGNPSSHCVL